MLLFFTREHYHLCDIILIFTTLACHLILKVNITELVYQSEAPTQEERGLNRRKVVKRWGVQTFRSQTLLTWTLVLRRGTKQILDNGCMNIPQLDLVNITSFVEISCKLLIS